MSSVNLTASSSARTRASAHTYTDMLVLPPLLHPPEQLLMFYSSKIDLVTLLLPHNRDWRYSLRGAETCQVVVTAEACQNAEQL